MSYLDMSDMNNSLTERVFKSLTEKTYIYLWQYWTARKEIKKHAEIFKKLSKYKLIDLTICCNDEFELEILSNIGFRCILVNHNAFLDEYLFSIYQHPIKYDAIYTTRLLPYKRIELASKIRNLALILAIDNEGCEDFQYRDKVKGIGKVLNHNSFFNPKMVCTQINQSKCGLILSEEEGANYATVEYLLCGIPVISTPNIGGRDVFLNKSNSIIVEPNADSVFNAVNSINPHYYNKRGLRDVCLLKMYDHRQVLYDDLESRFGSDWDEDYVFVNKLIQWE